MVSKPRSSWLFPLLLVGFVIFSGVWYSLTGKPAHVIYAKDDVALRQVAQLLDQSLSLPPAVHQEIIQDISAELVAKKSSRRSTYSMDIASANRATTTRFSSSS